jgi:hypothetical protein
LDRNFFLDGTAGMEESRDNNNASTTSAVVNMSLLEKTQAVIDMEQRLTLALERMDPWLRALDDQGATTPMVHFSRRVRPVPRSMDQVDRVLAQARMLGTRTSAPAGWNPAAPVMGFSTPNPLPHQLRGEALAALQLQRAQQGERERKRQKLLHQLNQQQQAEEELHGGKPATETKQPQPGADPAKQQQQQQRQQAHQQRSSLRPQSQQVSMNLSDSSDDDSDEDTEESE